MATIVTCRHFYEVNYPTGEIFIEITWSIWPKVKINDSTYVVSFHTQCYGRSINAIALAVKNRFCCAEDLLCNHLQLSIRHAR